MVRPSLGRNERFNMASNRRDHVSAKIGRVRYADKTYLVRFEGDDVVLLLLESAHPSADALKEALADEIDLLGNGQRVPLSNSALLSPVQNPGKFIAVGLNYRDHAREIGVTIPSEPVLFSKSNNSIIAHDDPIVIDPDRVHQVDYEGEIALVIRTPAAAVSESEAKSCILGYTICNDVTCREAQFNDAQWFRGKSMDGFGPLGPWIVLSESIDVSDLKVQTRVNGELLQDSSTSQLIFSPPAIVSYVSHFITLCPGDLITTGTPGGVGFVRTPPQYLRNNDRIEVEVQGIGRLGNTVRFKTKA
jgi:2-keto-4-pentenoate hydratase/2-oxohepta-3-ene-1,7-dioic acid hydratase in catechol pathway